MNLQSIISEHKFLRKFEITPELAKEMLEYNTHNRNVKKGMISYFSNKIRIGEFRYTHAPIVIDSEKKVIVDGQHRLLSCVYTGMPITVDLVLDGDIDAQPYYDNGTARNAGDQAVLNGIKNGRAICALCRLVDRMKDGSIKSAIKYDYSDAQKTIDRYSLDFLQTSIKVARKACHSISRSMTETDLAYLYIMFSSIEIDNEDDREYLYLCRDEFFSLLSSGLFTYAKHPVKQLRDILIADSGAKKRISRKEKFALTIKAWNLFRKESEVRYLKWQNTGISKEQFPRPI